jgi:hypothetical protein
MTEPTLPDPAPAPRATAPAALALVREPLVWLVALTAAALVVIRAHHTRLGLAMIAGAVGLAAVLRLVLSPRAAGLLAVRTRALDVATLLALTAGLVALAVLVPFPPGTG